ncbi:sulfotransferase [Oscillatoriales cyanobacterium LEGE 11467]|uniref:Sulfotransferase n=1 Tax=Zarconia navalis LEGE 11467 TaxID=1828826 RepID=A0A928VXQ3_9CYAN|nr:sulfotransferase [Zarconia navalis]MBE9039695.1 sulfotransferase [Zarconia navalis LEGE 11467]
MIPYRRQNTIFLVGCPRSGTTFLQSLLAAHSQIASFPESKFFQYLVPEPEDQPRRYKYGLVSRRSYPRMKAFFADELHRPELLKHLSKFPFQGLYTRQFINILHQLKQEKGKSILLEKTPEHINHIHEIEKYVPGAKFIHLVRNGTDVVASLYEVTRKHPLWWGGEWPLDWCIYRWNQAIEISQQHLHKPNHFIVRYESLVQNPNSTLKNICEFIDIEFEDNMVNDYSRVASDLTRLASGRTVKTEIERQPRNKFETLLNDAQQQSVLNHLSQVDITQLTNKSITTAALLD